MIYTVTFNPAIDCVMQVENLALGHINRALTQEFYYGGKSVNVSYVLSHLGRASTAWGFIAGWTGAALEAALQEDGIFTGFVRLPRGNTRINAKLKGTAAGSEADVETAVNAAGAPIDDESLQRFFDQLGEVKEGDFVILSGGIPKGTPTDIYARIMERLDGRGANIVVDATEDVLMQSLPHCPFLVKPNDEELADITGCDPFDESALEDGARMLQSKGARNVLVSRGGLGSLLFMIAAPPDGDVHLEVLARLMTMLMDVDWRNELLAAPDVESFLKLIDDKEREKFPEETEEEEPAAEDPAAAAVTPTAEAADDSTFNPAVLRSIRHIIEAGNSAGIMVGMCGEAAADPMLIPLWIAFGLGEYSVSATSVLSTRKHISLWTKEEACALADKVMQLKTATEVYDVLQECAR